MAGSESAVEVALDAGPIIHLDEIDALDLLADFTALTPDTVWTEVVRHRPRALEHSALASSRCPAPHDERVAALASLFGLGAGEREALAVARLLRRCMVFTDDAAAFQRRRGMFVSPDTTRSASVLDLSHVVTGAGPEERGEA